MPLFRWGHNWHPLRDLEREVDRLLERVNLSFTGLRSTRQYPAVNLYELDDEFLLTAELPGTKQEDLELTIADGVLTLKGQRGDPDGASEDKYRRRERFRGRWQRSMTIPDRVQEEQLTAEFNHGVLQIHLPKSPSTQPRTIPVVEG